ncbi:hypothetical protein [Actinomadura nitritigenes]|uniref:hypothetical protein n=1 Tax=Actinomadura nitritigenes TaxID=134602 RepID=UPI003D8BB6D4
MRRTPFPGNRNGCWDNLVRADAYMMSRQGRPDLTILFPFLLPPNSSIYDKAGFLATIQSGLQTVAKLSLTEAAFAAQKLLVGPSSPTKIPNLFLAGDWVKTPIWTRPGRTPRAARCTNCTSATRWACRTSSTSSTRAGPSRVTGAPPAPR